MLRAASARPRTAPAMTFSADDLTVRRAMDPEPVVTLGPEERR